jgi:sodium/pantothenate symporter
LPALSSVWVLLFTVAAFVAMGCVVAAVGGWYPAVEALATFRDKPGIISWHGFTGPGANWETPADALTWSVILGLAWVPCAGCQSLAGKAAT